MNIASIDIGTNTVLLLIAEVDKQRNIFNPLLNKLNIPRIGKGLAVSGVISRDKIDLLTTILKDYKDEADKYNCEEIIAGCTYPFRAASNSEDIIKTIQDATDINITTLKGEEEALFSFLGVTSDYKTDNNITVIDIGGGSTELIVGSKNNISYRKSAPFGVVNSTERLIKNYPVTAAELARIRSEIRQNISEEWNLIPRDYESVIAIAGTPTTLACIKSGLLNFDEELIHNSNLEVCELENYIEVLAKMTPREILDTYGDVLKNREDVILMGTIILAEICLFLKIDKIQVSSRGLRYGMIYKKYFQDF